MRFVSQGSKLITDNLNVARRRMFLMTNDVDRPTALDTASTLMAKIEKARSFSHELASDKTLNCTRAAGWSGNKYYHALVGPMRYDWADEGSGSGFLYLTPGTFDNTDLEAFGRLYSIGSAPQPSGTYKDDKGTMLNTAGTRYETPNANLLNVPVMLLPPFAGTLTDGTLYSTFDEAFTGITVASGSIGTVGQYENRTAKYLEIMYPSSVAANLRRYSYTSTALNNYSAGTEVTVAPATSGALAGPRILYGINWSSAGSRYYSGGGWNYNYTRSKLTGSLVKSSEANKLYGKGTGQADTAAYKFDWALMPVTLPDNRVLLQVADFVTDLSQPDVVSVANYPQITSNINDLPAGQTVFAM